MRLGHLSRSISSPHHIAVIGGGPAGLRAAEIAAQAGARVTLFDAKPSVGRKFLVAGKGGLNLSKDEPPDQFAARYSDPARWGQLLRHFDHASLQAWAAGLGIELFTASTGRIYPRGLKSAPLLRRWVERLRRTGVQFALRHRLAGWSARTLHFSTPEGDRRYAADATVLALGGGSWPETGSDGRWVDLLIAQGVAVDPLLPANCGWECLWPESFLSAAEGLPLKSIAATAAGVTVRGEVLITRYGLEGGALYQLGPHLRSLPAPSLTLDLQPELSAARLLAKLGPIRRNLVTEAHTRWRLDPVRDALLALCEPFRTPEDLVAIYKTFPVPLERPRPLAEAISSAGGVSWSELDDHLMLHRHPGHFIAGEMLSWEAPTGGYLIHGALASGTVAAYGALAWLRKL